MSATLLVRAIFGISCLLLGAALLLCQAEGQKLTSAKTFFDKLETERSAIRWVRTVDGWEQPSNWHLEVPGPPALHPLVVAAGQGLLSVFGLVLFQRDDD